MKIHELVDPNRGQIYQDFTDPKLSRIKNPAFKPYNINDDIIINEKFVNVVENKNFSIIRRPIFNITTLGEEFNKSVKNIDKYLRKSKNKEKFVNNLIKLEEYLKKYEIINEEHDVIKIISEKQIIKQQVKDQILNIFKEKLNIDNISYLGSGFFGDAYDIGNDRVLKITRDKTEAIESLKIKSKNLKHIANVYDVYQVKSKSENKTYYIIILEKLNRNDQELENKFGRMLFVFTSLEISFEEIIDEFATYGYSDKYKENEDKLNKYFQKNPGDEKFFMGMVNIAKEIYELGVESKDYLSYKNLGYKKDGSLAFFDLGFANPYLKISSNVEKFNINELNGKYSTDDTISRLNYPVYNNKTTEPSIENNLDANSSLYEEYLGKICDGYDYYVNPKSIKRLKSDIRGLVNKNGDLFVIDDNFNIIHNVFATWLKIKGYDIPENTYYNLDRVVPVQRYGNTNIFYLSESIKDDVLIEFYDDVFKILKLAKKKNPSIDFVMENILNADDDDVVVSEDRKKSYMPKSKAVTVKKKCQLGGLNGTSVACNQGDISNLQFTDIN